MKEIRTGRGKLVGKLDERAGVFSIKDGGKLTIIEIPPCGLRMRLASSNGVIEEVYIPPTKRVTAM